MSIRKGELRLSLEINLRLRILNKEIYFSKVNNFSKDDKCLMESFNFNKLHLYKTKLLIGNSIFYSNDDK